tara:strand:- start:780 stop:1154 length:375 start_codon:yes stop_codon:yes gene_type:complete
MALDKDSQQLFNLVHQMILLDRERAIEVADWLQETLHSSPDIVMLNPGLMPAMMKALQGSTDQLIKLLQVLQKEGLASRQGRSGGLFSSEMMEALQAEIDEARTTVIEIGDERAKLENHSNDPS